MREIYTLLMCIALTGFSTILHSQESEIVAIIGTGDMGRFARTTICKIGLPGYLRIA